MRSALWAVMVLIDRAQEGVVLLNGDNRVHVMEDLSAAKDVLVRLERDRAESEMVGG